MKRTLGILLLSFSASYGANSSFDPDQKTWTLSNGYIRASFQLTQEGLFQARAVTALQSGDQWYASAGQPMSLVRMDTTAGAFDAQTQYELVDQYSQKTTVPGIRQLIVLQDIKNTAQITVVLDLFDDQPVLRYRTRLRNLTSSTM